MSCKLYLENYEGSYTAGDEIIGRVECIFNESITRSIKIHLNCKEHNQWTSTENYYDSRTVRLKTRHVTYTGDNTILFKEQILYGAGITNTSEEHRLSQNQQIFRFKFVLPTNLPSTYEGPYGFVTYKLKAIVDRPRSFDYGDYCSLIIKPPLYVDKFPSEQLTQTVFEDAESVCCLCCKGGDISMVVTMPRMVFVPGENIDVQVALTNLSNLKVDRLKIKLEKTVIFKVTSPSHRTKTLEEEIFTVRERGVGAHGEHTYNLSIPIPHYIKVPNFTNCRLFEVYYLFQVVACINGCSNSLDVSTYVSLADEPSERFTSNSSPPEIGFRVSPGLDYPSAPPLLSSLATAPIATTDDINLSGVNPPSYESLMPKKAIHPGRPQIAQSSSASAPLLPSSSNNGSVAPPLQTPSPPSYSDIIKS